ncbi:hypothetical protein [Streptomyces sp. NPDC048248]|uniref:hypothetical protein n=1 Tax=Streptomyces sp. NPDC048248 TaxID=3365523 RepID=UPI003714153E
MKYAKSAAIVVGSVMALGAAAPSFAAGPARPAGATGSKMSVNGGLTDALKSKDLDGHQIAPLVDTVKGAADKAKSDPDRLLGGATGATKKSPLLGGVQIGK